MAWWRACSLGLPGEGDDRTVEQRRADALVELARRALDGGGLPDEVVLRGQYSNPAVRSVIGRLHCHFADGNERHGPSDLAIVVAMTLAEHVPLAEVKNRLSEVVDRIQRQHGRVVITKHGKPAAVMLSVEDLESLEETLEILGDQALLADIREAEGDLAEGRTERLTKDQALSLRTQR